MCAWYRSRAGSVILDYIVVVVVVVVVVVAAIVVLLVVVPSQDPFVASKPTYAPATYSDFIFGAYAGIMHLAQIRYTEYAKTANLDKTCFAGSGSQKTWAKLFGLSPP